MLGIVWLFWVFERDFLMGLIVEAELLVNMRGKSHGFLLLKY